MNGTNGFNFPYFPAYAPFALCLCSHSHQEVSCIFSVLGSGFCHMTCFANWIRTHLLQAETSENVFLHHCLWMFPGQPAGQWKMHASEFSTAAPSVTGQPTEAVIRHTGISATASRTTQLQTCTCESVASLDQKVAWCSKCQWLWGPGETGKFAQCGIFQGPFKK